jgi:hypothetical protein
MRVYSTIGGLDAHNDELSATVPALVTFGRSVGVGDFIELDVEADSHADAVLKAREAVEVVLDHTDIVRIITADHTTQDRQLLLWVIATRRQIRRWEIVLARWLRTTLSGDHTPTPSDVWQAQIEWHLALVAANNVVRAVANSAGRIQPLPDDMATDIRNHRDLQEHWDEQWPAFYDRRNPGPLKRSGKSFASRHPGGDPYWWLGWTSDGGPTLGPGLRVEALNKELDRLQVEVLQSNPDLEQYVAPIEDSPWASDHLSRWWPRG